MLSSHLRSKLPVVLGAVRGVPGLRYFSSTNHVLLNFVDSEGNAVKTVSAPVGQVTLFGLLNYGVESAWLFSPCWRWPMLTISTSKRLAVVRSVWWAGELREFRVTRFQCACATCHMILPEDVFKLIPEPDEVGCIV